MFISYVEDGGIEPWLKPNTIKFVFAVRNYEISTRTFQTSFSFIYGSVIVFFCMSVCLCVRVCVYKPNNNSCDIHWLNMQLHSNIWLYSIWRLNISLIYFRTMVSQLGTLLIVFGFWKYGKEYCSICYLLQSLCLHFAPL